jgi:class 3 adenylate cyclase
VERCLRRADRVIFRALFVVWLVSIGLCLDDVLRETPYPSFVLVPDAAAAGRAAVYALRPIASDTGIEPGDRLLRVNGRQVMGRSWDWVAAFSVLPAGTRSTVVEVERAGEWRQVEVPLLSRARYWPRLVASAAFVACALILFAARGAGQVRLLFAYTYLLTGLFLACFFAGSSAENAASFALHALSLAPLAPLSLIGFMRLDPTASSAGPWRHFAWVFALFAVFDLSRFTGVPFSPRAGALGLALLAIPFSACSAFVLVRAYRRSDLAARRRLKWVFLGVYLALVIAGLPEVFAATRPEAGSLLAISISGIGLLPLCVMVGIVRHNFLDIDRVLSATVAITLGVGALFTLTQFALPPLAALVARDSGIHETSIRIVMIVLLIALLVPVAGFLGRGVDRLFFASRLALEQRVSQLVQQLSQCEGPEALGGTLVQGLVEAFAPRSCVVYTRSDDVLSPALASTREAPPPAFSLDSPLAAALREQPGPLVRDAEGHGLGALGSFQRAVLETLDAEVVVPVRRAGVLAAFVCLGAKASGDAYTATDRNYLALIADKLGSELLRFDQEENLEASRALQARLRRYIPGPVVDRIDRGVVVDLGEIEVSVLFVDIRGYSHFVQSLRSDEVFALVNAYTELVSAVVRRHGGTVVEFNGDGMMAVFGAPEPLPSKEAAAVLASREIVTGVPALAGARGELSAGVGIATGQAFVGNIQSVDRLIWTALGNTTNLASRLQQLTREVPAAIVIDRRTWELSGEEASSFLPYVGAPIRGRDEREDLFLLPLRSAA